MAGAAETRGDEELFEWPKRGRNRAGQGSGAGPVGKLGTVRARNCGEKRI